MTLYDDLKQLEHMPDWVDKVSAGKTLNQAKFIDRIASGEHQREGGDSK